MRLSFGEVLKGEKPVFVEVRLMLSCWPEPVKRMSA